VTGLFLAGCSTSDAKQNDTKPQNNTDNPTGPAPGAPPGGTSGQGEGTGTGRAVP
jgi:hypothetical protein